jgi:hypothetical protein
MSGSVKMFGGVFVLRRIATSHVAALQAHSQMDPGIAHLDAFVANVLGGLGNADFIEVRAVFWHV